MNNHNITEMSGKKLERLEQRLYRAVRDIKDAKTPLDTMKCISRYGVLDRHYERLTGKRFNPVTESECVQDIQWGYNG